MSKKGGSRLLKKEAEKIAKKLDAEIQHKSKHIWALIKLDGVLITTFGIRHDKKAKHGHIPQYLKISEQQTVDMAACHISKEEYFDILKKKGILPTIH